MRKRILQIVALLLVFCCALSFVVSCGKKESVYNRLEKALTKRNYTIECKSNGSSAIYKVDGNAVYCKIVNEQNTQEYIAYWDKKNQQNKIYERTSDDKGWMPTDARPDDLINQGLGCLVSFFLYPDMFVETDGTYTYKFVGSTYTDQYTVAKDGSGLSYTMTRTYNGDSRNSPLYYSSSTTTTTGRMYDIGKTEVKNDEINR